MTLLQTAQRYAKLGYPIFPCAPGKKTPLTPNGFKDATTDATQIDRWWTAHPNANVAMATAGLIVIDIDGADNPWPEDAEKAESLHQSPTSLTPRGGRHHIYRVPDGKAWRNTTGKLAPRVDTRADGGYIVLPPSAVGGKPYRWADGLVLDVPTERLPEPPDWLETFLDDPQELFNESIKESSREGSPSSDGNVIPMGERNATLASLAGTMRHRGMSEKAIGAALLQENMNRCSPALGREEVERISASICRYPPAPITHSVTSDNPDNYEKPKILISDNIEEVVNQAESVLQGHEIYQRAGLLVRVTREPIKKPRWMARPASAPEIEQIPVEALQEKMSAVARWEAKNGGFSRPNLWIAKAMQARSSWAFPVLDSIKNTPVLRPDGSIYKESGYDTETGCLVEIDEAMLRAAQQLKAKPTRDDAVKAFQLLSEPFVDFPFLADSDRSATLAVILTLIGRQLIGGPAPMFASRSPVAGTGKSLLFDTIAMIAIGRPLNRMISSKKDEEERKRITAVAKAGHPVVLLDNVEHSIGSPALAAALTASAWEDRNLGYNDLVNFPLNTVWLCTGNNLSVRGDMARRTIPIDLDAQVELPEERDEFKYPNLLEHVRHHRPELVMAALTVLRAFLIESPKVKLKPLGGFEIWADLIRACPVWLGVADPCGGMPRIREEGDPEREEFETLLSIWFSIFGEGQITAREIVEESGKFPELKAALPSIKGGDMTAKTLGYYLRGHRGKIGGGLRLESAGKNRSKTQIWEVLKCG